MSGVINPLYLKLDMPLFFSDIYLWPIFVVFQKDLKEILLGLWFRNLALLPGCWGISTNQ